MLRIFVDPDRNYTDPVKYTWKLLAGNRDIPFTFVEGHSDSDLSIGADESCDILVSEDFYTMLGRQQTDHRAIFDKDCVIRTAGGSEDLISTCFYMANCVQEHNSTDFDEVGRFKYSNTYQFRFGNIRENIVQKHFSTLMQHPKLSRFADTQAQTQFFLSHDIDSVHGALLQDGLYHLKKGQFHLLFPLLFNAVMQKPDWLNIDRIMDMEDEYSFRSTFYWLVNQGKINSRLTNSDYDIDSRKIRRVLKSVKERGWENGLHKSISEDSMQEEMAKTGFDPVGNRYHYLRFQLPQAFDVIETSGLKLDASLGFAESYGFRNSYGQPFQPYNFGTGRAYTFVEVPLTIMDGTFQRYMQVPQPEILGHITDFFEANRYNCVLSVLWHNTFFTHYKYKGYLDIYKKLLGYLYETKFPCITQSELIGEYKWSV